ncbi:hypothetical protein [Actinomycetospora chlora]|uniref:hypothetical protein n=1 Tax=Actinomycetospora chlora TaxID=663608 RepID=UPI0031E578EC
MTPDRASAPRALLLGLVAALLGAAAHGAAGGALVASPVPLGTALAVLATTALVGVRPRAVATLVAVLAGGQLALHLSLPVRAEPVMHAHDHGPPVDDPTMLVAHLAVAALVAAGLAHADRALGHVARRVVTWARRLAGPPPAAARDTPPAPRPSTAGRPRPAAVGHHPRRGPPSPHRTGHRPVPAATPPRPGRTLPCTTDHPPPRALPDPARPACWPSC